MTAYMKQGSNAYKFRIANAALALRVLSKLDRCGVVVVGPPPTPIEEKKP